MPDTTKSAALAHDYATPFAAGFLTTVLTAVAVYVQILPALDGTAPVAPRAANVERLDFASQLSGRLLPPANMSIVAKTQPVSAAAKSMPSPATHASVYEIADRFADLTPVVSPRPIVRHETSVASETAGPGETQSKPAASQALVDAPTDSLGSISRDDDQPAPPQRLGETTLQRATIPKSSARLSLVRSRTAATRAALPLDFNSPELDQREVGILVAGLPDGVTLSSGRRTALGLWKLNSADAKTTEIIIARSAPAQFLLTVLLLDQEGPVVNGMDLIVALSDAGPGVGPLEVANSPAATSSRSARRRGAAHAATQGHKSNVRDTSHRAKRSKDARTITTLWRATPAPASWNAQRSKVTAQN